MVNSIHRKSHRKSRNGCLLCKKRHVKVVVSYDISIVLIFPVR